MTLALVLSAAYLLGSFPTSYLVVLRLTGRDIRTIGTGNPGTMNVLENVGRRAAIAVGLGDIGKGLVAVGMAYLAGLSDGQVVLAALLAVVGHNWSVWLRFDGGNGTGPVVGALFGLLPLQAAFGFVVATLVLLVLRSRRTSGIVGLLSVPIVGYLFAEPDVKILGAVGLILFTSIKIGRAEGFSLARPSR